MINALNSIVEVVSINYRYISGRLGWFWLGRAVACTGLIHSEERHP